MGGGARVMVYVVRTIFHRCCCDRRCTLDHILRVDYHYIIIRHTVFIHFVNPYVVIIIVARIITKVTVVVIMPKQNSIT